MHKEKLDYIQKPLDAIERFFTMLAIAAVFLMALLTAADAMGRYFLNHPINGAFEVTENYLMIFAVYFAFARTYKNGANVRITFFVARLPWQAQLIIRYFVQIFSICYLAFVVVSTTRINLGRLDNAVELTQTLSLPIWPAYLVISLGLVFVLVFVVLDLRHVKSGRSGLFKESSDEAM